MRASGLALLLASFTPTTALAQVEWSGSQPTAGSCRLPGSQPPTAAPIVKYHHGYRWDPLGDTPAEACQNMTGWTYAPPGTCVQGPLPGGDVGLGVCLPWQGCDFGITIYRVARCPAGYTMRAPTSARRNAAGELEFWWSEYWRKDVPTCELSTPSSCAQDAYVTHSGPQYPDANFTCSDPMDCLRTAGDIWIASNCGFSKWTTFGCSAPIYDAVSRTLKSTCQATAETSCSANAGGVSATYTGKCRDGQTLDPVTMDCVSNSGITDANNGPPQFCPTGNPINQATGNKFQIETDFVGSGPFPLELTRVYNAGLVSPSSTTSAGTNWRHTYHRTVSTFATDAGTFYRAARADGKTVLFKSTAAGVVPVDPATLDALSVSTDASGGVTGYRLTTAGLYVETYDADGKLVLLTSPSGLKQTLSYNARGYLDTVVDPGGRTLKFNYKSKALPQGTLLLNLLDSVTDPAGNSIRYSYDASNNLFLVTYQDGATRKYAYGEPEFTAGVALPSALTGVVDEAGARFATFRYDATGRAIGTEHVNGIDKVTLSFGSSSTTIVDPLGSARTETFTKVKDTFLSAGSTQPPGSGCPAAASSNTYDGRGNLVARTDFDGSVTRYEYDLVRNLETRRIEAYGTALQRTTTTTWHPTFRLPDTITTKDQAVRYTYDATGRTIAKTLGPPGLATSPMQTWTYAYDARGLLQSVDGPRTDVLDVTTLTYDPAGNLASVTDPAGLVSTFSDYDAFGRPRTIRLPSGVVATHVYDSRGRLTMSTVGDESTSYAYDIRGLLAAVTMPSGASVTYAYDDAHRLTGAVDGYGNRLRITLDPAGNATKRELLDPAGRLVRLAEAAFDALGRAATLPSTNPSEAPSRLEYDVKGNLVKVTDPLARVTAQSFDALNRLTTTDGPRGALRLDYDASNRVTSVTSASGLPGGFRDSRGLGFQLGTFTYDALGKRVGRFLPETGKVKYAYWPDGTPRGWSTSRFGDPDLVTRFQQEFSFDAAGRLTGALTGIALDPSLATPYAFVYDQSPNGVGRLSSVRDSSSLTFAYDKNGRLSQLTRGFSGTPYTGIGASYSTAYEYARGGKVSRVQYPSSRRVEASFDSQGSIVRLASSTVSGVTQVAVDRVTHDATGLVDSYALNNGIPARRTMDLDGRVGTFTLGGKVRSVTHDATGLVRRINDADGANATQYAYDSSGRLSAFTSPAHSWAATYDSLGNRLSSRLDGNVTSYLYMPRSSRLWGWKRDATLYSYNYDAAGNLLGAFDMTGGQLKAMFYDTRNRLQYVQLSPPINDLDRVEYRRDYRGRIIARLTRTPCLRACLSGFRISTTVYHYDESDHLLSETDGSGKTLREYIYLEGVLVAVTDEAGAMYSVEVDHLATPRRITDAQGKLVWSWENADPFGAIGPNEDPDGDGKRFVFNLRFEGQYYDEVTGLFNNGVRTYDPKIGRYIEADPIGLAGGMNPYVYVDNNPVSFVDPTGLVPIPVLHAEEVIQPSDGSDAFVTWMFTDDPARVSFGLDSDYRAIPGTCTLVAHGDLLGRVLQGQRHPRSTGSLFAPGAPVRALIESLSKLPQWPTCERIVLQACNIGRHPEAEAIPLARETGKLVTVTYSYFGMSRGFFASLGFPTTRPQPKTFYTTDQAMEWLGLQPGVMTFNPAGERVRSDGSSLGSRPAVPFHEFLPGVR